jgi:hypothetical protein
MRPLGRRRRRPSVTEEAVELFQAVLGQMLQDRAVEGINDEAVGYGGPGQCQLSIEVARCHWVVG